MPQFLWNIEEHLYNLYFSEVIGSIVLPSCAEVKLSLPKGPRKGNLDQHQVYIYDLQKLVP